MCDLDNKMKPRDRPRQLLPFGFVLYVHDDLSDTEVAVILRHWYAWKNRKIDALKRRQHSISTATHDTVTSSTEEKTSSPAGAPPVKSTNKPGPQRYKSAYFRKAAAATASAFRPLTKMEFQSISESLKELKNGSAVEKSKNQKKKGNGDEKTGTPHKKSMTSSSQSRSRSNSKERSDRKRSHSASSSEPASKVPNKSSLSASRSMSSKSSTSSRGSVDEEASDLANNNQPKIATTVPTQTGAAAVSTPSDPVFLSSPPNVLPTPAVPVLAHMQQVYRPEPIRLKDAEVQVKMSSIITLQKKALMLSASTQTPNLDTDDSYEAQLLRGGPLKPVNQVFPGIFPITSGPQGDPPIEIKLYMNKTLRERQHFTLTSRFSDCQKDYNIFDGEYSNSHQNIVCNNLKCAVTVYRNNDDFQKTLSVTCRPTYKVVHVQTNLYAIIMHYKLYFVNKITSKSRNAAVLVFEQLNLIRLYIICSIWLKSNASVLSHNIYNIQCTYNIIVQYNFLLQ